MTPLPCPFCGADAGLLRTETEIICTNCGATGPSFPPVDAPKVTAAWNRRVSPWQDISTAPKDGTMVLVSYVYAEEPVCDIAAYMDSSTFGGSWLRMNRHLCRPTHWMPLPPPPSNEELKR
jgi:hypothetical protein